MSKNVYQYNKQEVFDLVIDHLVNQKYPAIGKNGNCVYRDGTRKCAIGLFIPDDLYTPCMEYDTLTNIIQNYGEIMGLSKLTNEFLSELQDCHDKTNKHSRNANEICSAWKSNLETLARRHNLNKEGLKKFEC